MKACILFTGLFLFLSVITAGQKVIYLSVDQPPEFGFSINGQDTAILLGTSLILGKGIDVYGGSGEYKFLWTPSETLDNPALLHPMATPKDTTIYSLTVTDKYGCSFTVNYTIKTRGPLTGIDSVSGHQNLEAILFPNPNDGIFKVNLTGEPAEKIDLTIFDTSGRMISKQVVSQFKGDHTETFHLILPPGAYTIRLDNGNIRLSRLFIIQ